MCDIEEFQKVRSVCSAARSGDLYKDRGQILHALFFPATISLTTPSYV